MTKATDIQVTGAELYFLPVETRVPLKFGTEELTYVTCARTRVRVEDRNGNSAHGWGETPLSVQWVWPSSLSYQVRHEAMKDFCRKLTKAWAKFDGVGHPMEIGYDFIHNRLFALLKEFNEEQALAEPMPYLSALVCGSLFDIAVHDAFGVLHQVQTYKTYTPEYMNRDLAAFLTPAENADVVFEGSYPADYLVKDRLDRIPVWHLVGGKDLLEKEELTGAEPDDGYPVVLRDWIQRDALNCLKIKLRGNDAEWDLQRLIKVGEIAIDLEVDWLTSDFNCTVQDPQYVNDILDQLMQDYPSIYGKILYVEQPFPYDLEEHRIDVHSVSARKPLFMDESAHDWELVKLGRSLGWTGVALKTCKTQTGALLSLCWAKAHGMTLMVQDLTNPMLAQVPHVLLGAHAGTIMGVESNGMQFYPDASIPEEKVHPGLYKRRNGVLDLSSLTGPGFGYQVEAVGRELPEIDCAY